MHRVVYISLNFNGQFTYMNTLNKHLIANLKYSIVKWLKIFKQINIFFYVLLTVHLSIFISVINQLWAG